jgi:CBS domain-containing protein
MAGCCPETRWRERHGRNVRGTSMKVREFMSREVVTSRPQDPIQERAQLLVESSTRVLPVVNGDGSIVGLLTEDGLLIRLED